MNCEQVEELLSAYLDNALAAQEGQSVATHVQSCAHCSSVLADYQRFDALLSELPRISPNVALRDKLFSSQEYLDLLSTGTTHEYDDDISSDMGQKSTAPQRQTRRDSATRPRLVAIPGGLHPAQGHTSIPTPQSILPSTLAPHNDIRIRPRRDVWGQRVMHVMIAATLLLTLGIGSFIALNIVREQGKMVQDPNAITPPFDPQTGPIPAGMRFVFLRDGRLWSASADGSTKTMPLTPANVTVAPGWVIKPAVPGRNAGNMLAYIDLRSGFVHTVRSDGQSDTALKPRLLKTGQPSSVWDTKTGATILNSLAWSKDGSMLTFVADVEGTGQTTLYLYTPGTNEAQTVPLPTKGSVAHASWSPDNVRIAFEFSHDGSTDILDYNTRNHGLLTIASQINTPKNPNDTVLTLDWSPSMDAPSITWSEGTVGHVHSVWIHRVGTSETDSAHVLVTGDYIRTTYHRAGSGGTGSWLLLSSAGHGGELFSLDLNANLKQVASGKQIQNMQWSPDGIHIDYIDALTAGTGTFHIIDTTTGMDTIVATGVTITPKPTWSSEGQRIVYSTGAQVFTVDVHTLKVIHAFPSQGSTTTFAWSATSPYEILVAVSDGQQGVYLLDTQHDTSVRLNTENIAGPTDWMQIP